MPRGKLKKIDRINEAIRTIDDVLSLPDVGYLKIKTEGISLSVNQQEINKILLKEREKLVNDVRRIENGMVTTFYPSLKWADYMQKKENWN